MRKKQILICDDDNDQYETLQRICQRSGYDVHRSKHWKTVLDDIRRLSPIHLLVLDLGFDENLYDGHHCLPAVLNEFPTLKVVIFSQLAVDRDRREEFNRLVNNLRKHENVTDFLSSAYSADEIAAKIDEAIGTSRWLVDGEVWLLQVSDMQFSDNSLARPNPSR